MHKQLEQQSQTFYLGLVSCGDGNPCRLVGWWEATKKKRGGGERKEPDNPLLSQVQIFHDIYREIPLLTGAGN